MIRWIVAIAALFFGVSAMTPAQTPEPEKIQYLIGSVEKLAGAQFIRNGSAYDARAAADHLRLKLREAGSRVKTAEDFIRYCGSKSSMSGEPYRIRFADGTTVTSEEFLRGRLKALEHR